jgi:hypothetical protein
VEIFCSFRDRYIELNDNRSVTHSNQEYVSKHIIFMSIKYKILAGCWWFMPVIAATEEA